MVISRDPDPHNPLSDPTEIVCLVLDHASGTLSVLEEVPLVAMQARHATLASLNSSSDVIHACSRTARLAMGAKIDVMSVDFRSEVVWEDARFVQDAKTLWRTTVIIVGSWSSVCVMFPAEGNYVGGLEALAIMDASADPSELRSREALDKMIDENFMPLAAYDVARALLRTWSAATASEFARIYARFAPSTIAVVEGFVRALSMP